MSFFNEQLLYENQELRDEIERLTAEVRRAYDSGFEAGHFWNRPQGSVSLYKADIEHRDKCWKRYAATEQGESDGT